MSGDPHLVALLSLRDLGPFRLRSLLDAFGEPEQAWEAVARGRVGDTPLRVAADKRTDLLTGWRSGAAEVDVASILPAHRAAGIEILDPTHPDWPETFVIDPEPPPVLFARGDPALLSSTSVAIVGTRRCTAAGTATARELGEGLSASGIGVVSGLALGIDGAAHRGALRGGGPVVGVVATGLDVVYPRRHRDLWSEVAVDGVLVSEAPLGTKAERWRFPARNRLIAALSRFVVVVESKRTGGSMLTVDSAVERVSRSGPFPGRCGHRCRPGRTSCCPKAAPSCATRPTSWSRWACRPARRHHTTDATEATTPPAGKRFPTTRWIAPSAGRRRRSTTSSPRRASPSPPSPHD